MDPKVKQVKVDNWGIYFLQRLKHFFNRTDYCDLTLQFQDNAQLKVHRLVLSACTEYFELLERTCEMYEDCLVMPDDLQADVVVPIVNFMYTGQLEFHMDSLERLFQTSQVMNMPVLTKLLESHRVKPKPPILYAQHKRSYTKELFKTPMKPIAASSSSPSVKRSYTKAFANNASSSVASETKNGTYISSTPITLSTGIIPKRSKPTEPRPTRYDLPDELDGNIFDDSFADISYTSEPLMIHPETRKRYPSKKPSTPMFSDPTSSKRTGRVTSVMDIMESKKVLKNNLSIFDEDTSADLLDEQTEMFQPVHVKKERTTVSEDIFDQMMDIPQFDKPEGPPKVTIENKNANQANNIDHAKIISEVLKKYPHLMKSNKNIKLKILNTPSSPNISKTNVTKIKKPSLNQALNDHRVKTEQDDRTDSVFESDVLNSQEAAKLIALGAENVKGPWICLICGTPGRAIHFPSYYKFRRHLVEVHKEKPMVNICEYCGLKSSKRNYMLHHLYTKHGVEPPAAYHFPKCNSCSYVALTEALLVKHKNSHVENRAFRCYVCPATFNSSSQLLVHIRATGHKFGSEKKTNLQCIYCLRVFLRESNLFTHIKANHKAIAVQDGIIDDSDDESNRYEFEEEQTSQVKFEPPNYEEYEGPQQYEIMPDGNIELVSRKLPALSPTKQKILNTGLGNRAVSKPVKTKPVKKIPVEEFQQEVSISPNYDEQEHEEIVMIDDNEYVVKGNQLILRKKADSNEQFILSDGQAEPEPEEILGTTSSMEYTHVNDSAPEENIEDQGEKIMMKNTENMNQSLIVVSNEEEYKALMNANHSIIFDDTEANKTLTVLSTPHSATLTSTSMDLANTQPNEMMVIHDDYPLTVSEAMPGDNNIMVVYGHQNKPYQIITSQGLDAQYVQSAAVVTQNFEGISGSTPVVTDHQAVIIRSTPAVTNHQTVIIDADHTGSWPQNIATNEIQNAGTEVQEMSEMTIVEPAEITAVAEDNDSMTELPEVTMQVVTMEENSASSSNAEGIENIPDVAGLQQNDEEIATNVNESCQEVAENNSEELIAEEIVGHGHDEQDTTDKSNEESAVEETMEVHGETEPADIIENAEITETANESTEVENGSVQDESQVESRETTLMSNGVAASEETSKPVEALASEWSEDEYDTNEESANNQEKIVDDTVEETIENIQQEMDKQISEAEAVDYEGEVNADTEESEHSQEGSKEDQPEAAMPPPPEKISSLLNDWEDNDSQEGNEVEESNEAVDRSEGVEMDQTEDATHVVENAMVQTEPVKDKLKSLVSDWDEEEEDKS